VGLNFYANSPRHIRVPTAQQIASELGSSVTKVGVFVNSPVRELAEVYESVGLDAIQLHGDEPPRTIVELGDRPVVKAFRCLQDDWRQVDDYLRACEDLGCRPQALLIDAHRPGHYGGTGTTVDWPGVAKLVRRLPEIPVILAGGLRPDNVAEAIRIAAPWAVDAASGVESAPGEKDPNAVRAFIRAALTAFEELKQRRDGDENAQQRHP
jgi:phosphoribosylanthranilate isomerase